MILDYLPEDIEAIAEIGQSWHTVFAAGNAFGFPFRNRFRWAMIFCQTEYYELTEPQFDAIMKAARAIDDGTLMFATEEGWEINFAPKGDKYWELENATYEDHLNLGLFKESAHWSTTGQWGLLISDEFHAVVGGTDDFMRALRKAYPKWRDDLAEAREVWADSLFSRSPHLGWIDKVVAHYEIAPDSDTASSG